MSLSPHKLSLLFRATRHDAVRAVSANGKLFSRTASIFRRRLQGLFLVFIFTPSIVCAGGVLLTATDTDSTWNVTAENENPAWEASGKATAVSGKSDAGQEIAKIQPAARLTNFDLPTFNAVGDNTSAIIQEGSMMVAGVLFLVACIFSLPYLRFSEEKKSGLL